MHSGNCDLQGRIGEDTIQEFVHLRSLQLTEEFPDTIAFRAQYTVNANTAKWK